MAEKSSANQISNSAAKQRNLNRNIEKVNREFQENAALKKAKELGLPYINIGKTPLNPDILKLMDFESAKKARLIPFFRFGKKLRVAMENPENPETKTAIKTLQEKSFEVSLNLASATGIDEALAVYQGVKQYEKPKIVQTVAEKAIGTYEKEIKILSDLPAKLASVTAEEGLNLLNIGAMKTGASDIHYEPQENTVSVRIRIDGVLHKIFELDAQTFEKIANQIKYESKMRLNIANISQDGRYVFDYNQKKIAVRVSSIPTPYGEAFVCRFLIGGQKIWSLEELGFQGKGLEVLTGTTQIANGMILCTGPTGSGKSTTLYSLLSQMNSPESKIITLEDPVEFYLAGVTQSQIDEKHGYGFSTGLKAVLRQDPDIVMLGEIRDLETAETAAQAALTGHILLSTLHTNSAVETVPRLINIGLPPFMIAPALNTIIAQRLVRRICSGCAKQTDISPSERAEISQTIENLKKVSAVTIPEIPSQIPRAAGCETCSGTGYKGRIIIAEVLTISQAMKDMILKSASTAELTEQARKEGLISMKEDGILKVLQGITTLEEVHRTTTLGV